MNLEAFLHQVLQFTGTFDTRLVIIVFFACAIGELGFAIPYLMETIWLSSGYNVGVGALSPLFLLLLWLSAQSGRQIGAIALSRVTQLGSTPLMKFYRKYFKADLVDRQPESVLPSKISSKKGYLSPFSVALARLMWLRIPLTVMLGIARRWQALSLGILLSSIIWDGAYISLGMLGGSAVLKPAQMVAYSLIGLTAMYALTFIMRRLSKRRQRNRDSG